MIRPWMMLESALLEAKDAVYYRDRLFNLVKRKFGEDEFDKLVDAMQKMPPAEFRQFVELYFVDPEVDELAGNMVSAAVAAHPERSGAGREPRPTHSRSTDKGSAPAEPIPARPRPGDVASPLHGPPRTAVAPGEKPVHAVGSAGQNRPRDPGYMRPNVTQGPKTSAGVIPQRHDPEKDPKSGIVAAQREVDRMYKAGDKSGAMQLAAQLGVPTPEERFHYDTSGHQSFDAAGNPRIVVWSPDRVFKWRKEDSQHLDVGPERPRVVSMQGVEPKPKADRPDRLDMIKRGLVKRNVAPSPEGERVGPDRPPSFDGEVWRPAGRSGEKRTMRPDPVTGNFVFGKRETDPAGAGAMKVGYQGKWYTPSEYAARRAREAGVQPKGEQPQKWRAWQHPPRRGFHAGPTPASPPRRLPPRAEPPEDEFSDEPTDPGVPRFDDEE